MLFLFSLPVLHHAAHGCHRGLFGVPSLLVPSPLNSSRKRNQTDKGRPRQSILEGAPQSNSESITEGLPSSNNT